MRPSLLESLFILLTVISGSLGVFAATIEIGPGDSIQAAIYEARPGDTVEVQSGTYYEHIIIDKSIHLRGKGMPLLDATASGSSITLIGDGVTLEGFRVINSGNWPDEGSGQAGIKVSSNDNILRNNNASNNSNGIILLNANNNTITGNDASRNLGYGIKLNDSSRNKIFGNIFTQNFRMNAFDAGLNQWDNGTAGNHYGDFDSEVEGCDDANLDGICDSSYKIPGGSSTDKFPVIGP